MGCCGDKRQALRETTPAEPPAYRGNVTLRYLERSPVRVRGPITGQEYSFSTAAPEQTVDARDAQALVATRFFKRV
jgi:hypothetical protein